MLKDADEVYASAVSVLEIRIKTMLGKLTSEDDLLADIKEAGLMTLSFNVNHADALVNFPELRKHDPFDRMLIAQAECEKMTLLTSDTKLLGFAHSYVSDSRK